MNHNTALHTAARKYCLHRFIGWIHRYEELRAKEGWQVEDAFKRGWEYSDEAYRTFPRYRVDKAIQVEVERLRPDSSPTLEGLRTQLLHACDIAEAWLHAELQNSIAQEALREEADDYRAYIQVLAARDLGDIETLPFRRVLNEDESKRLWSELKSSWGIEGGHWFPCKEGPVPANVMIFHEDYFKRMPGIRILREALKLRDIERIFQLHEFDFRDEPDYEVELSNFEPAYGCGGGQYSTSEPANWIVYASHESSIAIGGDWLTKIFAEKWPEWNRHTYGGPYSTTDLRGTWDLK
jgi:hypothetical protein